MDNANLDELNLAERPPGAGDIQTPPHWDRSHDALSMNNGNNGAGGYESGHLDHQGSAESSETSANNVKPA